MKRIRIQKLFSIMLILALLLPVSASANNTAQTPPFSQDWSNTDLITVNDNWDGVLGIVGFRGDNLTAATGVDPQTVLAADDPGVLDVNANQTNPDTFFTGGVAEFENSYNVVALQGSGTADAPYLKIYLDTSACTNVQVAYNLRDIDGSADNAVQPVALHYRVGGSGNFTNVPTAYVTDATTGPSLATLVTPVAVTLPSAVDFQSLVELRIMTTNAVGNDEWVGVDDISITCATDTAPSVTSTTPANGATGVAVDADLVVNFSENVDVTPASFSIACNLSGNHTYTLSGSGTSSVALNPDSDFTNAESCSVTVIANQVSDSDADDPPDNMAADYTFTFDIVGAPDTAPSVSSTTPANGATGVAVDADVVVNFSENVDVTTSSFTISCASSGAHTYALSGSGTSSVTLNPDSNFTGGEVCNVAVIANQVSDSDTNDPPDNMAADYLFSFTVTPDACGGPITQISAIQGSGTTSPMEGATNISTEGIVVGDFQGTNPGMNGFFIQDPTPDLNPDTSEGLFVYGGPAVAVNVGDLVRVKGRVWEYNGQTELSPTTLILVCPGGSALTPTTITFPELTEGDLERYEGMLVTIPGPFTVDQLYWLGRYGQINLSVNGRMYNPTNGNGLGDTADYNLRRMIMLDDGSTTQNPNPIPYYAADGALRAGDTVGDLTGVIDNGPITSDTSKWDYRIQPTVGPVFTSVNPRTTTPDAVGGTLKVASFNVLNYFTTLDTGSDICGPSADQECRGADSALEFTRQRDKIIAALSAINADVVGLIEIENNPADVPTADLVSGLNAVMGAGTYDYIATGAIGSDAIRVAFIYKPAVVSPVGSAITYQLASYAYPAPPDPTSVTYTPLYDRPPLVQAFEQIANGQQFAVVVNHFKSKGCDGTETFGDVNGIYGCWNSKRIAQSEKLLEYVNALKGTFPSVLVIGDLNAYGAEPPINTWTAGGIVDEVATRVPAVTRYTYVFDGQAGNLDQGLSTPYLDTQVTGVTLWHINSDEPSVIDYNTEFKTVDLYTPTPYYSSDHDPVIIGLNLVAPTDTYADDDLVCGGNLPCFATIQGAINAVADGGTVHVYAGTYNESPDLNKNATVNIEGDITINGFTQSAGTFNGLAATMTLLGDFTVNGGTFNAGSGTVEFAGSVLQVIGGSLVVTFNNLTINNTTGVKLGAVEEVEGALTLMGGVLNLDGYDLNLGDAAFVIGSFDSTTMIAADGAGALCKEFSGIGSFTFPIGDLTGDAEYSPFSIDFTSGTFVDGVVCVNLTDARHSSLGGTMYITRYWTVISRGITGFSANVTGSYVALDVMGTEGSLLAVKYDDPNWTVGGPVNTGDHSLSMTVTGFSDFAAGSDPTSVITSLPQLKPFHGALQLKWETANEANLLGFNVYRSTSPNGERQQLNTSLIPAQAVGLPYGASYEFMDASVLGGQTYYYWVEIVEKDGTVLLAPVSAVAQFALYMPVILK
jgi:predicted extracellular nuclease